MNSDQIKARCEAFLADPKNEFEQNINKHPYLFQVSALESLCHEMIAVGLERAAQDIEGMLAVAGSSDDQIWDHIHWCRAEAQRIKGG